MQTNSLHRYIDKCLTISICQLLCLLLLSCISFSTVQAQPADAFRQLKRQFRESHWMIPVHDNEQLAVDSTPSQQVDTWEHALQPDGSWSDIDYADKTRDFWKTSIHLQRTLAMAVLYAQQVEQGKHDAELCRATLAAVDYWTAHDFQNPNWWQNEIGVPNTLSDILLLMEDALSPAQKAAGMKILKRITMNGTGQNLAWKAGIVFKTAMLEKDAALAEQARAVILRQISVTTQEGVQPDWSYHQHGPQQQMGNYGLAFTTETVDWAWIWRNTPWAMPADKIAVLRNYLLHGEAVVVYQGALDISACDRQLFPNSPIGKAHTLLSRIRLMAAVDPTHAAEYRAAVAQDSRDGAGIVLNKNFYRSDYMVHRRPNYYASVKMSSRRVIGEELVNKENLSGRYLADGAFFLYQAGGEYKNIFPVWDWHRIPGVTSAATGSSLTPQGRMDTDFAGGVSDGAYGAAALTLNRDGVRAQKSWFFLDDVIFCLGAGISSNGDAPVVTTVDQSLLQGNVIAGSKHSQKKMPSSGAYSLSDTRWIWHNQRGYFFPTPQSITLQAKAQSGAWTKVSATAELAPLTKQIFSLWIDHGAHPSAAIYSYAVLPQRSAAQVAAYARHPDVKILSNTSSLQAVESRSKHLVMAIFHAAGTVQTSFGGLQVKEPCAVMLRKEKDHFVVSVADPAQQEQKIELAFRGKQFSIALPQNGVAGDSAHLTLP